MAPASTAVRSMASLVSLLLAVSMVAAQSAEVLPSNATLPTSESASEIVLSFTGGPIPTTQTYNLAPLTDAAGKGQSATAVAATSIIGTLKQVDYSSTGSVGTGDVAYISCDPNGSNIDPSTIVGTVGDIRPKAIVLYSLTAEECNLTGSYQYNTIFSMTSSKDSSSLMIYLGMYPPSTNILTANIAANNTNSNSSTSSSSTANSGGPAPTTAVAMSILYSITGIITLLFLVIIATGAVRAHRHPERYGPRTAISGRPRQSRAKGLARAMLETLPIVKFGDPEATAKPNAQDIELGDAHTATDTAPDVMTTSGGNGEETAENNAKSPMAETTAVEESGLGPAESGSVHSHEHDGHDHDGHGHSHKESTVPEEEGHLGCSICTDDFCTGEDVRVLPCNHKFHPACIDPWLLNVSGTCPLCRHDLRPAAEGEPGENAEREDDAEARELPPPLPMPEESVAESEAGSQHRSRAARLLDLHRLRHAPADERIAALRELREQTQNEGETADADAEEPSRRARVTGRLRDAFRIKTRTQDTPNAQ